MQGTMLSFFLTGFRVGLNIAMPVGPMAILCIRRSLTSHRIIGIVTGVAIAMADSLYALVAALGISTIRPILDNYPIIFQLLSIGVISFLGISTLRSSTPEKLKREQHHMSVPRTFFGTFIITLASPMTILLFASLFSDLGAMGYFDEYHAIFVIAAGVTLGAATWFIGLSTFVHAIRKQFTTENIAQLSIISGIALLGFAGWQLTSTILDMWQG